MALPPRLLLPLAALVVFGSVAASCADDGDQTADSSTSEPSPSSSDAPASTGSSTTTSPSSTSSTTSEPSSSTTAPATTTTSIQATTTSAPDTDPPAAPTGLSCSGGGGSGEAALEWDTPPADDEVTTVRVYVKEEGGSFTRLDKFEVSDPRLSSSGGRWGFVAYPVWAGAPVEIAVTHGDSAGNESGWNPIEAYITIPDGSCNSGPPPEPAVLAATRSGGSLEVDLRVDMPALDVVDWSVTVDQGSGFVPLTVLTVQAGSSPSERILIVMEVDWSLPATYRVVAVDAHGNSSAAGERVCGPISPGDVAC